MINYFIDKTEHKENRKVALKSIQAIVYLLE